MCTSIFTSIFNCIMAKVSNFTMLFIFIMFILILLYKYNKFLQFHMISAVRFLKGSFKKKKRLSSLRVLLRIHKTFSWRLYFIMYTSCLFSRLLNAHVVDINKSDQICSLAFVLDEFSGLFLHPSIFSIKHLR